MPHVEYMYDEQVALCPIEDGDVPRMQRWVNDMGVLHYLGFYNGMSEAQETQWLERMRQSHTDCAFAMCLRKDGRHIGSTGLHGINARERHAEFGILIGEREFWSKGYGTAAARMILNHGFNQLNLHRIFLRVFDHNLRGQASYRKLGFVEEGRLRQHQWREDGWHDMVYMGLLRDEFNAQWADWRQQQLERYLITPAAK